MSYDNEQCAECGADLGACKTIFAAEGSLFCSKECGIKNFRIIYAEDASMYAEDLVTAHFDDVAEEINPQDIGIERTEGIVECDWCHELFDKSEVFKTDLGDLCAHCIEAIRSRGEEVLMQ